LYQPNKTLYAVSSKNNTLDDGTGNVITAGNVTIHGSTVTVNNIISYNNDLRINPSSTTGTIYLGHDSTQTSVNIGVGSTNATFAVDNGGTYPLSTNTSNQTFTAHNTLDDGNGNMTMNSQNSGSLVVNSGLISPIVCNSSGVSSIVKCEVGGAYKSAFGWVSGDGWVIYDGVNNNYPLAQNSNINKSVITANGTVLDSGTGTASFIGTVTVPNLIDSGLTATTLTSTNGSKQLQSVTISNSNGCSTSFSGSTLTCSMLQDVSSSGSPSFTAVTLTSQINHSYATGIGTSTLSTKTVNQVTGAGCTITLPKANLNPGVTYYLINQVANYSLTVTSTDHIINNGLLYTTVAVNAPNALICCSDGVLAWMAK